MARSKSDFEIFEDWVLTLSEKGRIAYLTPEWLLGFLVSLGANQKISLQAKYALGSKINSTMALGMGEVWGERFDQFMDWVKSYVMTYEENKRQLPFINRTRSKTHAMVQFFDELTAYAFGKIEFALFKEYFEDCILNGRLWEEWRRTERLTQQSKSGTPVFIPSIPPDFPRCLLEYMRSWK
jgi:hypothetical protein